MWDEEPKNWPISKNNTSSKGQPCLWAVLSAKSEKHQSSFTYADVRRLSFDFHQILHDIDDLCTIIAPH